MSVVWGAQLNGPVDGFLNSASMLYLPTVYRANVMAQMEVLRLARGYRPRWYTVPEDSQDPIPPYSQVEFQVAVQEGSYVWGLQFWAEVLEDEVNGPVHILITDACTETPAFSDYARGIDFADATTSAQPPFNKRHPMIFTPRIVGDPAMLNVEIYSGAAVERNVQLVILVAEPMVPSQDLREALVEAGMAEVLA